MTSPTVHGWGDSLSHTINFQRADVLNKAYLFGFCSFILTACASKMPLERASSLNLSEGSSLVLFSLTTKNEHTKYRLEPRSVTIKKISSNGKASDPKSFEFPTNGHEVNLKITTSFGNLQLAPGKYSISQIDGFTELAFVAIIPARGRYNQKVNYVFNVQPNEIAYLGNLEAVLQKKNQTQVTKSQQGQRYLFLIRFTPA
jgi:hypothetical protein